MKILPLARCSLLVIVIALALLLGLAPAAYAATIAVKINDPNIKSDGFCSLIEAIINANDDAQTYSDCPAGNGADIIQLQASGPYVLTAIYNTIADENGLPSITSEMTIDGHGAKIVRSDNAPRFRIFSVAVEGTLTLKDLKIMNGSATIGAGIFNHGKLRLIDSIVSDNNTGGGLGGGIYNSRGTVSLIRSVISNNNGDGIFSSENSFLELITSTVRDNHTSGGGGGISNDGVAKLTNSTILENSAGYAGGIDNYGGTVELIASSVLSNSALREGAGIRTKGGNLTLTNSTVSFNHSEADGGGISTEDASVMVTNSLISDNRAGTRGGGIQNFPSSGIILTGSIIRGNQADTGGGIFNGFGGTTKITNSRINGNIADTNGGGIFNEVGTIELSSSTISDNRANGVDNLEGGGGIFVRSGTATLTHTTVTSNHSRIEGGGIFNDSGLLVLSNSTVSYNDGIKIGGGIFNQEGRVTIVNSTLSNNRAIPEGGGIFNSQGQVTLTNSTISNNSGEEGGGINNSTLGQVELVNTIVAANVSGPDCFGVKVTSNGHNLDSDGTCVTNGVNGDITNPQPHLGPLQLNPPGQTQTIALKPGSPAIDAGDNNACPPTDQRGISRPQGEQCDIGAFELEQNGSLTIIKEAAEAEPGHQFAFFGDLGEFKLNPGKSRTFGNLPPDTYSVLEDGRSFPQKGHWDLISVRCHIVGDGWFYPEVFNGGDIFYFTGVLIPVGLGQQITCTFLNESANLEEDIEAKIYLPLIFKP